MGNQGSSYGRIPLGLVWEPGLGEERVGDPGRIGWGEESGSRLDLSQGATAQVPGVCGGVGMGVGRWSLFLSLPFVAVLANGPWVELGVL